MSAPWEARGENDPWPEGLFVAHEGKRPDGEDDWEDLGHPENGGYRHVVFHLLRAIYALDFQAVRVSGLIDDMKDTLRLTILKEGGGVLTSATVEAPWGGWVQVEALPERGIRAAVRRDLGETLASAWLEANGYHPEFPCAVETHVNRRGHLSVEASPLW